MSQNKPFDPAALWQEMIQKWEQEINAWSGKVTETEQFSAVMGQATKMQMVAQRAFGDQMEKMLRSMNLPSKAQIDMLGERIEAVEEAIDRLRLALEAQNAPPPPAPAPKRTRKPPQEKA